METLQMTVRRAVAADYDTIDQVVRAAYTHDYGSHIEHTPLYRASVRNIDFSVWVAVDQHGRVLGSVSTRQWQGPAFHTDAREDECDIRLLAVAPEARRLGIAEMLMNAMIDHAKNAGWRALFLKSAPEMLAAHRLYHRLGFTIDADREGVWVQGELLPNISTFVYELETRPSTVSAQPQG